MFGRFLFESLNGIERPTKSACSPMFCKAKLGGKRSEPYSRTGHLKFFANAWISSLKAKFPYRSHTSPKLHKKNNRLWIFAPLSVVLSFIYLILSLSLWIFAPLIQIFHHISAQLEFLFFQFPLPKI